MEQYSSNIVFDLDGTLIDSSERMYQLFKFLIPQSTFSKEEYWEMKRSKINHEMILGKWFPEVSFPEFNKEWLSLIETDEYLLMDEPYEDTLSVLESFTEKNKVFLLTARQLKASALYELERMGLSPFFEDIFVTEAKSSKSEILTSVFQTGTLKRSQKDYFISDMGADIEVGNLAGFQTVAITHGFMNRECLLEYSPNFIIDSLTEMTFLPR